MKAAGKRFLYHLSSIIQLLRAAGIVLVLTVILEVLLAQAMKLLSSESNLIFFLNVIPEALPLLPHGVFQCWMQLYIHSTAIQKPCPL
jgi:hypothetical protein